MWTTKIQQARKAEPPFAVPVSEHLKKRPHQRAGPRPFLKDVGAVRSEFMSSSDVVISSWGVGGSLAGTEIKSVAARLWTMSQRVLPFVFSNTLVMEHIERPVVAAILLSAGESGTSIILQVGLGSSAKRNMTGHAEWSNGVPSNRFTF